MNRAALGAALAVLFACQAAIAQDAAPVAFRCAAAEALTRNPGEKSPVQIDRDIAWIRDAVSGLAYDTYRTVYRETRHTAPMKRDTDINLTDRYTFVVEPLQVDKESGKVRLEVRIVERIPPRKPGERETKRDVVRSVITAVPGEKILIGGPNLDAGKLVVVFMVERR